MKNFKTLMCVVAVTMLAAAVAFAGTSGGQAPAVGKVNVSLTVPKVASGACTTIAPGRASYATVNVAGTTMMNWTARHTVSGTSAGTAEVLKRSFNSNSAYMPASSEYNLPIEAAASTAKFARYSGATTITLCSELN